RGRIAHSHHEGQKNQQSLGHPCYGCALVAVKQHPLPYPNSHPISFVSEGLNSKRLTPSLTSWAYSRSQLLQRSPTGANSTTNLTLDWTGWPSTIAGSNSHNANSLRKHWARPASSPGARRVKFRRLPLASSSIVPAVPIPLGTGQSPKTK